MSVMVAATQMHCSWGIAANVVPVIASNRIGSEESNGIEITFYGSSFITDHCGAWCNNE